MKIAEVVCTFPPYKGGTGQVAYDNAKILFEAGNEVIVFSPFYFGEKYKHKTFQSDFEVKRLYPFFKYGNGAFLPQLFWYLKNFDVIHLHYPFFGGAEIVWFFKKIGFLKAKLIITYHQDAQADGYLGKFFNFHNRFIVPLILKSADKIIVSSFDYVRHSKIKKFFLENNDLFLELPFGVDVDFYKPGIRSETLEKKYGVKDDEDLLLFIGGLDKAHYFKGVNVLIKAFFFLKNKNLKLIIVGDGDLLFDYKQIAFNFGLRDKVIFTGKIDDNEKKELLKSAKIFILPSINSGEAFGIVLLEAMSSGVPVIASDLPGVRTVVDDGENGFLVKPNDPKDLADKINILLKDDNLRENMRSFARKKVEKKYNLKKIKKDFLKIFQNL